MSSSGISLTIRPPTAPNRPSPLGNSSSRNGTSSRAGPPSRRLFEQAGDPDDDDEDHERDDGLLRPNSSRRDDHRLRGREGSSGATSDRHNDRSIERAQKERGPRVIPALPNKDWRAHAKRTPSFQPEARPSSTDPADTKERINDEPQRSGLRFAVKSEPQDPPAVISQASTAVIEDEQKPLVKDEQDVKREPLTLEEQALQAILAGDAAKESAETQAQRDMVIGVQANRTVGAPLSEAQAFQRDVQELPEESTMADFEAVPISGFGIAALRGMGWDPSSSDNVKVREVVRRPELVGLGATPMADTIKPTHGKSAKDKKKAYQERGGRGFTASGIMLKRERDGSGASSINGTNGANTPIEGSSRRTSPSYDSDASRRRRRDADDDYDNYDSGRDSKRRDRESERLDDYRRRGDDGDRPRDSDRDRDSRDRRRDDRYSYSQRETEEDRARRKARERERERDRDSDRRRDERRDDRRDRDREYDRDRRR